MENRFHTVVGIFLGLVFAVFTVLQFNDPDPLTWISIYGMIGFLVVYNTFKPVPPMLSLILMFFALAGAFLLWPKEFHGLTRRMDRHPSVELARESLGMLICAATCAYMCYRSWKRRKRQPEVRF